MVKLKTRRPKGPWVAHLRKRSKVTVEPFTEDYLCCTPNIKALIDFYKTISRFPYIALYKSDMPPGRAPFYTTGTI